VPVPVIGGRIRHVAVTAYSTGRGRPNAARSLSLGRGASESGPRSRSGSPFEKITFPVVPNPQTAVGHNTRPFFTLSVKYAVMTNASSGRTLTTTHKYFGPTSVALVRSYSGRDWIARGASRLEANDSRGLLSLRQLQATSGAR
jgi:hypothetical protein